MAKDINQNTEERWRKYTYKEIIARDKTSVDIFWLKDKSLTDLVHGVLKLLLKTYSIDRNH